MPEGSEPNFSEKYEANMHRAHISAYVLIAGLILELINGVVWYHGIETIAAMLAVLLIVGGVWGEVFFGNKARVAGDAQLAQYEARTAEANERAEEARHQGIEARLELLRFRTARAVLFKEGPTAAFIANAIRQFAGTNFDTGFDLNSGEQADFAWCLQDAPTDGGWVHIPWKRGISHNQGNARSISGSVGATNVEIHIHPESRDKLLPAATALISVLNEWDIAATDAGFNAHSENVSAIHILIGGKG
jgi:hypothetical protein